MRRMHGIFTYMFCEKWPHEQRDAPSRMGIHTFGAPGFGIKMGNSKFHPSKNTFEWKRQDEKEIKQHLRRWEMQQQMR